MPESLLTTKLYVPPLRPGYVARSRLIERLNAGRHRKLTLVSAPAGFGKTTLVVEWLRPHEEESSGETRPNGLAWLSLDEGDNDPIRFLRYVAAALQRCDSRIGQVLQQVLQSPQLPPLQSLVASLINDIASMDTSLTLVLDDYHFISASDVHHLMQSLLERAPPRLHIVLTTREDPPLSLPQLRARGQVTELRERDLRFTTEEAAAFFSRTMGLSISVEASAALESRTEGWIAGLQLAALAIQEGAEQPETFVKAFAGSDRYVMDYLIAEVLQRQPPEIRSFLQRTAILNRLNASLCDALLDVHSPVLEDARSELSSQAILEQLERTNLFVMPLDHRREWYRYHRLFAEFLTVQLGQAERRQLHLRAAQWHEAHNLMDEAVHHALASNDLAYTEQLVAKAADQRIFSGDLSTVRKWLDAIPDARVRSNPDLALSKGLLLGLNGEMASAEDYLVAAEGAADANLPISDLAIRGKLQSLRGFIALFAHLSPEAAIEHAREALNALDDDRPHWRILTLWMLGEASERTRPISEAIDVYREARQIGLALENQFFTASVEAWLAFALNTHGERRAALRLCEQALPRFISDGRTSPVADYLYVRMGELHYEANDLEQARRCFGEVRQLSQQLGEARASISDSLAAPLLDALGQTEVALAALQKAIQTATEGGYIEDPSRAVEANMRLKHGDAAFAEQWATKLNLSLDDELHYIHLERHLTFARLLLARKRWDEARQWLERMAQFTRSQELYRALISVQVLLSLAAHAQHDEHGAREYLVSAVGRAAPENYLRAFLDEGAGVIKLLPAVRHVAPAFVDALLVQGSSGLPVEAAAFRGTSAPGDKLVEPLSDRELEVLALIAGGLTNGEIAHKLYIAEGTVKRHINNIYGKLEVRNRAEAIGRARERRLLA
jgi:LuxR family maltose regulon positive regulatory protein